MLLLSMMMMIVGGGGVWYFHSNDDRLFGRPKLLVGDDSFSVLAVAAVKEGGISEWGPEKDESVK